MPTMVLGVLGSSGKGRLVLVVASVRVVDLLLVWSVWVSGRGRGRGLASVCVFLDKTEVGFLVATAVGLFSGT